jgi:hypothetical protein
MGALHMTARFSRRRKPARLSEDVDLFIIDVLGALGDLGGSILIWVSFVSFVSFVVQL